MSSKDPSLPRRNYPLRIRSQSIPIAGYRRLSQSMLGLWKLQNEIRKNVRKISVFRGFWTKNAKSPKWSKTDIDSLNPVSIHPYRQDSSRNQRLFVELELRFLEMPSDFMTWFPRLSWTKPSGKFTIQQRKFWRMLPRCVWRVRDGFSHDSGHSREWYFYQFRKTTTPDHSLPTAFSPDPLDGIAMCLQISRD